MNRPACSSNLSERECELLEPLPPSHIVYHCFRTWRRTGVCQRAHATLRRQWRLSKDFKVLCEITEACIRIAKRNCLLSKSPLPEVGCDSAFAGHGDSALTRHFT